MGVKKIRFFPTNRQRVILKKWIGTSRYTYNQAIHKINNEKQKVNFFNLRNKLVPKKKIIKSKNWILETPKDIRAEAVRDAVTAYKSAFSNLRNKNIHRFKVGYKSKKKSTCGTITIPKSALKIVENKKGIKIYSRFLKKSLKIKEQLLDSINHDIKVIHDHQCNQWFICVPRKSKIVSEHENQGSVASVDPGDKTLMTIYDHKGNVVKIGNDDLKKKLVPLYKKIDKLISLVSKSTKRRKYRLKRRISLLRMKMKNLILEIHTKACRYLCLNYETILISNLGKVDRKTKINRRNGLTWSHGKLIERLKYYGTKLGSEVLIISEEYTSKTCSNCGTLENKLGNKDILKCKSCGVCIDRDTNGARNILIKHLK